MTNERDRREELGLTQPVAAARAEVSLETWQRWEEDPTSVGDDIREKCEHVIHTEAFRIERAEQVARFEQAWKDCSYLTSRQAIAIATRLVLWSYDIDQWLHGQSQQPLHEVGPFESIDRRAMMYVNDNKAWAAKAQERCDALSEEIERGVLPFERDGCFFDELLIGAALADAEAILAAVPEMFEDIPARAKPGDQDGAELQISDDDWNPVSDTFIDRCRWEPWQVALYRDHPRLTEMLAEIHPYVWFDPPEHSDAEYEEDLRSSGLVEGDEEAMSPAY